MKYMIVGCLDEGGLARGGVDGMSLLAVVRENIEDGSPPFARGRFRELKIKIDEWGKWRSTQNATWRSGERQRKSPQRNRETGNRGDPY